MAINRFLEDFDTGDFRTLLDAAEPSLLDAAEPRLPPWRAAEDNPAEPLQEEARNEDSEGTLGSDEALPEPDDGLVQALQQPHEELLQEEAEALQKAQAEEDARTLAAMAEEDSQPSLPQDAPLAAEPPLPSQAASAAGRPARSRSAGREGPQDAPRANVHCQRGLDLCRLALSAVDAAVGPADESAYSEAEHKLASDFGARWQDRGPRGDSAPSTWRGQPWRQSGNRYGNRGGNADRNRFFAEQARKAKDKGKGKDHGKGKSQDKGTGKSQDKGKGKGKGNDSGSKGKGHGKGKGKGDDSGSLPDGFWVFINTLLQQIEGASSVLLQLLSCIVSIEKL